MNVYVRNIIIFLICFFPIQIINADSHDMYLENSDFIMVTLGDTVCNITTEQGYNSGYVYGVAVYNYNSNRELEYFGKLSLTGSKNCLTVNFDNISNNNIDFGTDKFLFYNGATNYYSPVIVPYKDPDFELVCEDNNLKYGEQVNCFLYYTPYEIIEQLKYGSVLITKPHCVNKFIVPYENSSLNVVDYFSKNGDVSFDNNTFLINDDSNSCEINKKNEFLKFAVTLSKEDVLEENIKVEVDDFVFINNIYENVADVQTSISVNVEKENIDNNKDDVKNPNTNSFGSIIVILLLIGVFFVTIFDKKPLKYN